ncbi:MAG: hypothetical protein A2401_03805 [Candidatus Staskawiczbacteria bacterium RIFOXYC1_FULL_38_18]|uniref:FAD-binding FR-type domain-containing protein n=1 Tax=Candidatus Staskawiczbacteria bacterium RIFOXYC1_FULL_38_18 TaxID=1802229 RepID=A0A1G2JCV1_9BACT|nr:MAG: hypothetical protein A2401_03805 [Candidatus Staskawiczbacteria bacterium RIFOXYC1_FULL_38_18]
MQNKILARSGWYIIIILSLAPSAFWFLELPISARFSGASEATQSLGQIAGLTGMAMFSLMIILSARLKIFEKVFAGINEAYVAHHFFGGLTFCLLLFHPLLLAYQYLQISSRAAALFLLPSAYWPQNFGIIALLITTVTLVITFYIKLKYQIWKFTHKFMGLAFIFAFFHVFLIGSNVGSNQLLRTYLFILGMVAIAAFLYRAMFGNYFIRRIPYVVEGVDALPDKIFEVKLVPLGQEMKFVPGQFVFVKFYSNALTREAHPFSMSSANGNQLKFGIKESGDYTSNIGKLKVGDKAEIEGPFGAFSFRNHSNRKQAWIAGGVGVTPFMSMLRSLNGEDSGFMIDFYYCVKDEAGFAFRAEIEEIVKKNKNLRVIFWTTDTMGFINSKVIKNKTPDINNRDVLICGSDIMMSELKKQFLKQGINKNQIHTEEFKLY